MNTRSASLSRVHSPMPLAAGWLPAVRPTALSLCLLLAAPAAFGQDESELEQPSNTFGVEAKVHYRDTDEARFGVNFPFSATALPVGQSQGFLETVEPGSHFDAGALTLWYKGQWDEAWGGGLATKVKIDLIDRYDRNPTSTDDEWDVDEAWLRWGPETEPGEAHEGLTTYVKLGKFPKFERQDDRHLESYGLVSTAFNRMEDIGLEIGSDMGSIFYTKTSYTEGNPVFLRDPNALAGDNGIPELRAAPNPDPELKSGIPIPYDADLGIDDVTFDHPEIGFGLGARFGEESGAWNLDILAFYYHRELADTRSFDGSFYGGDLDLLLGPGDAFPFAVSTATKEDVGLNLWLYAGGFSFFGQYVDQDLGGMSRDGFEVELAYDIELPWAGTAFGRQLFPFVAPAIRYSELNPDFPVVMQNANGGVTPSPSFGWDWQKLDVGVRLGILTGLDLTLEYSDNEFVRKGKKESADELLATLRFNWDWSPGT